jgi:hypothetical protein
MSYLLLRFHLLLAMGWTESRWGKISRTCPDRPWGPPSLLYNGYRVFPGGKERPGRDADPSPPSSIIGHERVKLYLCAPYRPYGLYRASVPVQGCTLPLPFITIFNKQASHWSLHSVSYTQEICALLCISEELRFLFLACPLHAHTLHSVSLLSLKCIFLSPLRATLFYI